MTPFTEHLSICNCCGDITQIACMDFDGSILSYYCSNCEQHLSIHEVRSEVTMYWIDHEGNYRFCVPGIAEIIASNMSFDPKTGMLI